MTLQLQADSSVPKDHDKDLDLTGDLTLTRAHSSAEQDSVLLLEAFYGGSHKQMIDTLERNVSGCVKHTMTPKKWHWRARTSALYFTQIVPAGDSYRTLFTSSVLPLAELCSLRPDLAGLKKVLYFHENQLAYPVSVSRDRDFQYGYNQITSCLVADVVLFNSDFNMDSFLFSVPTFLNKMPDYKPEGILEKIRPKCRVLYFPIEFINLGKLSHLEEPTANDDNQPHSINMDPERKPLHIVWVHRWEHDKDPDLFFQTLFHLRDEGFPFKLSVLGENFSDIPDIFQEAKERLAENILNWGFQETKDNYFKILIEADLAVSTARHEFFGVAMLEAAYYKCYPLCPNKLVYPEIFPKDCLYSTDKQLYKRIREFCHHPQLARNHQISLNIEQFTWNKLKVQYEEVLKSQ